MSGKRWKLSRLDLLQYALWGVRMEHGHNTGNPAWSDTDFDELERAERELERRIKIIKYRPPQQGGTDDA